MTHMLEYTRNRRHFERADILSRMGETIFLSEPEIAAPKPSRDVKTLAESAPYTEDPERWDGMS